MSTVRSKIRNGWTPVKVLNRDNLNHSELYNWAREYFNSGEFGATLLTKNDRSRESLFAFKNEQDASHFIMKWK